MSISILKIISRLNSLVIILMAWSQLNAQNVGVGVTNPTQPLDVGGAIKFSGSLLPAGNLGTAGQALTSQGGGLAPIWASATANQQFYYTTSTSKLILNYTCNDSLIPGLTKTITVPATGNWDAFIYTDGGARWSGSTMGQDLNRTCYGLISFWIDGVRVKNFVMQVDNTNNYYDILRPWNFALITPLSAGTHTIQIKAKVYKSATYFQNAAKINRTNLSFAEATFNFYDWSWLVIGLMAK